MKSKFFLALFLFVFSLPLFCQDYLIRVDFSEVKLFLINDVGIIIAAYPVAVPGFSLKDLPAYGTVARIEKRPRWYPTEGTRQYYLKAHGIELPRVLEPDDPRNAMGVVEIIIKFDSPDINPLYRIHGTNDDNSIGTKSTRGCIRMHNKDILELIKVIESKQTRVLFEK